MYFLILGIALLHCSEAQPDCSAVTCHLPAVCAAGSKIMLPEGECCFICVPDTGECEIQGQEFSNCASTCPATCEQHNPICIALCVPGCKCPTGQVVDTLNRRCVQFESCPPRENPCNRIDCQQNAVCKIFKPTGEAFCEPSCTINNGGCQPIEICSLVSVMCVRAPCPSIVQCIDPCTNCTEDQICKLNGERNINPPCPIQARCLNREIVCSRPPKIGPCDGLFPRFFHNATSGKCEMFIYGGCNANDNNFATMEICEKACKVSRTSPCSEMHCPNGYRCEVFNGEGFCNPDCSLNNGGCLSNQTCRLDVVVCVRAPCPPFRICEDRKPCATVRCANGYRCKVSQGEPFCDPDCNLNNGGCASDQLCFLQNVICIRFPCPLIRICKDIIPTTSPCPPTCSKVFCHRNGGAICSNPGSQEIPGCTGSCQLTYCRACYFSPTPISPPPGYCTQCILRGYLSSTWCFRNWARCTSRAHRELFGHPEDRDEDNFRCYSPPCPLRG